MSDISDRDMRRCLTLFYVTLFVAAIVYRYPVLNGSRESQAFAAALLFMGVMLLDNNQTERFDDLQYSEPLEFDRNRVYNPTGWRWTNETTITTTVEFHVSKGECDYANLVARPGLGFPSKSDGFGYTTWNRLQGTNAWFAWNEGTGGSGWFWWKPTAYWYNLSDERKRKFLQLDLMITSEGETPSFPVGYSVTCPDYNFSRSVRLWVDFTYNPMWRMEKYNPFSQGPDRRVIEGPPLIITDPTIVIPPDKFVILNQFRAEVNVPIQAQQGGIDWTMLSGNEKNGHGWFSWKVNTDSHLQSRSQVVLHVTLNSQASPPRHFPAKYTVEIKDAHRDRYVRVVLVLLKNPFSVYIEPDSLKESKSCPDSCETRLSGTRCRCNLPLLLRPLCPPSRNNQ